MSQTNIHHCHHCGKATKKKPNRNRKGERCDKVFCDRYCYDKHRESTWRAKGFNCKTCGKRVEKPQESSERVYCSMQCRKNLNIKSCVTKCKVCKTIFSAIKWRYKDGFTTGFSRDKTRKLCSPECVAENFRTDEERKRKISESERGEKHHNWQGGTHRMGGRGAGWSLIAEKVRKRAGYKCEHCGKPQSECGRRLDVNHKIPFHQHPNKTQSNKLSNLEALCKSCHMITEWKWRKSNHIQLNLNIFDGY